MNVIQYKYLKRIPLKGGIDINYLSLVNYT